MKHPGQDVGNQDQGCAVNQGFAVSVKSLIVTPRLPSLTSKWIRFLPAARKIVASVVCFHKPQVYGTAISTGSLASFAPTRKLCPSWTVTTLAVSAYRPSRGTSTS